MSHTVSSIIACPQIQEDLNRQFTSEIPNNNFEPQGFTDFVISPMNTSGTLQRQVAPGGGKKRKVELLYTPPILESEISTDPVRKCVSENEAGMLSQEYEIGDTGVQYDEKFSISNMAEMCKDNPLWFAQRIQAMFDGLYKKIGTINATQLGLLTGKFGTGETGVTNNVKTISTRKANGDFDIDALAEMEFAASNTGYGMTPFIFGYHELYKYYKKVASLCCANEGVDYASFAAQNASVFVADKKITNVHGANTFFMLKPGAVQLLSYLEFEGASGINTVNDESYKQTVLVDPRTGLRYDFQLKNDCGDISVSLKLNHKLVGLPNDMYSVGDPFHGVTFVNEFAISNPS
jgi:hypothetical protein